VACFDRRRLRDEPERLRRQPGRAADRHSERADRQIAFGRGDRGFVVINREEGALSRTFQTGMPAGVYCDVIQADFDATAGACSGPTVTVGPDGQATIGVNGFSAVAIYGGAKRSQ